MKWSREKPTELGWYWIEGIGVVWVDVDDSRGSEGLKMQEAGKEGWRSLPDGREWYGPLEFPETP